MDRYARLDNQSPAESQLKAQAPDVGRSAFDFSFNHVGSALIGALTPFDCFDVVPNEDIDLSLIALFEFRNPSTRQLFNGFRVFFHYYYNRLSDLWEGARNWLDNGRTGKINLSRPNLIFSVTVPPVQEGGFESFANSCTPMSLLNYLGLPVEYYQLKDFAGRNDRKPLRYFQTACLDVQGDTVQSVYNHVSYFPADCAMAYQRNWRDFYSNKNLLQNNKYWFPDNEDHFILSYACENACSINYEDEDFHKEVASEQSSERDMKVLQYINLIGAARGSNRTPEPNNPATNVNDYTSNYAPNLSGLKFRQFRGDRFSASSPFVDLIRGDLPLLSVNQSSFQHLVVDSDDVSSTFFNTSTNFVFSNANKTVSAVKGYETDSEVISDLGVNIPASSITMSDIYTLETLTAFRRKMGMTNGDYNETIQAQYGVNPRVHDRKGTYIGGFYQDFALSSVIQQSESAQTPLGTKAGQGISSGSGNIGHFHTPDFGWIQGYFSIVPDVFYLQGKPRMFSKKSNLEMYFPLFNNLPAQSVRTDELYVTGLENHNQLPFAYEDRYAEYKSRPNRVSGLISLPISLAQFDASRVMARRFSSAPTLNHLFVTMVPENIDYNVFSVNDEPPFDFAIGVSCRRVFPAPYVAIEGSLSSPRLNA